MRVSRFGVTLTTLFLVPTLLWAVSPTAAAAARDCTADERAEGNAQLMAIRGDPTRQATIIKRHLPFGAHIGRHASQGGPDNEDLLLQEGYALLHDTDLRTGLWVSYKLTGADIVGAEGKDRVNCFRTDPRFTSATTAIKSDYDEPIYDQGHLANDADMKDDLIEQINTYMMSNMSPQHCRFNRGVWLSLEHIGRIWAEKYETIYITSGAIFDFNSRDRRDKDISAGRMGSRNQKARVAIPSDYYKIFLREEADTWHSIAFLLEHNNTQNGITWEEIRPLVKASITTIEAVEQHAEVTFHPNLNRNQLVQSTDGDHWDFQTGKANFEGGCK